MKRSTRCRRHTLPNPVARELRRNVVMMSPRKKRPNHRLSWEGFSVYYPETWFLKRQTDAVSRWIGHKKRGWWALACWIFAQDTLSRIACTLKQWTKAGSGSCTHTKTPNIFPGYRIYPPPISEHHCTPPMKVYKYQCKVVANFGSMTAI